MDELFPIIMDMLQDSSSLAKRQVREEKCQYLVKDTSVASKKKKKKNAHFIN